MYYFVDVKCKISQNENAEHVMYGIAVFNVAVLAFTFSFKKSGCYANLFGHLQ